MGLPPDFVYEENIKLHAEVARLKAALRLIAEMGCISKIDLHDEFHEAVFIARKALNG